MTHDHQEQGKGVAGMLMRAATLSLLLLLVGCGGTGGGSGSSAEKGSSSYSVYFHVDGYNFDPTGGNMRVNVTYYANGVGASGVVISSLPWSSSAVSSIPSGGNVAISGSLTSSYNCNGATVTVSIMANGQAVQSGTFACGSTFSLHETLP
jgi:hypothetical protein